MIDYEGSWDRHISLVEFVYNSFLLNIGMAPYKALYGRKCRTPLRWTELREKTTWYIQPVIYPSVKGKFGICKMRT